MLVDSGKRMSEISKRSFYKTGSLFILKRSCYLVIMKVGRKPHKLVI